MKNINYILAFSLILIAGVVKAQFDDLYYDPEIDDAYYNDEYFEDEDDYDYYFDDDEYDSYDDYDYYYSSRIRRFNRRAVRPGFRNSWAYNSMFYDPFDFYGPYGAFGGTYLSIGFGVPYFNFGFGFPAWNNWGWRNNFYNPGFNSWGWANNNWGWSNNWIGGGFGNPYCPPFYGGGFGYGPGYVGNVLVVNSYNQQSNPKGTYYGSRRGGSTSSSVKGVRNNPRIGNTNNELLTSGARSEADSRGQAIAGNQSSRSPRRTLQGNDELAVSRLSERPGRTSVTDGTVRGGNETSARRTQRPTRRSVSPYSESRSNSAVPSRRSSNTQRSSVRREYPSSRRNNNSVTPRQSTRRSNNFPSSTRTSPTRSSSPSRSSGSSSSRSSSSRSSGSSSSPRRGG